MSVNVVRQPKRAFLLAFADCGSVTEAAERVGIDRTTHYNWMKNESYRAEFQKAQDRAMRVLEDIAVKRGKESSDTLLIFLLKSRNRKVFGDRLGLHDGEGNPLFAVAAVRDYMKSAPDSE